MVRFLDIELLTDNECLAFARAYNAEQAAQVGEPNPEYDQRYSDAECAEMIECVRRGIAAVKEM